MSDPSIIYCDICSLPPEYCAWGSSIRRCTDWLSQTHPTLHAQLYPEISNNPPAATDSQDKLERRQEREEGKKRATKVVVRTEKRQGKKMVTVVTGLDVFGVDLKKASKLFSNKFATGSSVGKNAEGHGEVSVQGDLTYEVVELIELSYSQVPKKNIQVKE